MIIIDRTNPNPYPSYEGQAKRVQATTLPNIPKEPREVCICDVQDCEYYNYVFADSTDTDGFKNDKSSFLLRKYTSSDNITFKLLKNDEEIATISDNTYGTYYGSGVGSQSDYRGLVIEWRNVFNLHGSGVYQIQFDTTIIGVTSSQKSVKFYLLPYSDESADRTVRIRWTQNGSIKSSEFDFTGLNWEQEWRLAGKFWNSQPSLEVDNYLNGDYKIEQIQDRINTEYDLAIDYIPSIIGDALIYDCILGNSVEVTSYDLQSYKDYLDYEVQAVSVDLAQEQDRFKMKEFLIKFTNRKDNVIKTNY